MARGRSPSREIPLIQRFPARPTLAQVVAAVKREFGVTDLELKRWRYDPARLALAYIAREQALLRLSDFAPALGIQSWAASHLTTSAERLAQSNRQFQKQLERLRRGLTEVT